MAPPRCGSWDGGSCDSRAKSSGPLGFRLGFECQQQTPGRGPPLTLVTDSEPAVAPVAIAGLLLAARTWLAKLGLPHPSVAEILEAAGATRSRAYEIRDQLSSCLPGLVQPPGRPRAVPDIPKADPAAAISRETLRFVMDHPGCVHGGTERRRYADVLRHRIVELRLEHPDLDLAAFAEAAGVPAGTVEGWMRPSGDQHLAEHPAPTTKPDNAGSDAADAADAADVKIAIIETVLHAWQEWHGDFTTFCNHLRRHHRIDLGNTLISTILFAHGERTPKRRGRRHSDERALRHTFHTFFPGAQWVGDGAEVSITLDGQPFAYNLELIVDAFSGAFAGTSIRDTEDATAVVEAFEAGIHTTGSAPIALLLDNRPSNHSPEVDQALGDTLRIRATESRPQNKAHVEGAFGLFAQHTPPIDLCTSDRRQLGHQLVALIATLFACILNHRPRRDRQGKSRAQIYNGHPVTEQQRKHARRSLHARLRRQERARRTREARLDPDVRLILDQAFARLGLLDPERHFRDAIACYPLDAIVDGAAIFEGKRVAGTLPASADARYLLGIVRNLHHVHQSDAITDALIRTRLDARDLLLEPLARERDALLQHGDDPLPAFIDRAILSPRAIDRSFWLHAAADLIAQRPLADRQPLFRAAAKRIHATFACPIRDRFAAERALARLLWPLS